MKPAMPRRDGIGRRARRALHGAPGALAAVAVLLAGASPSHACPSCWGNPDSPITGAMNSGIFFMLGVTGIVLGWFVAVIFTIRHRTKRWEARKSALKVVTLGSPTGVGRTPHA